MHRCHLKRETSSDSRDSQPQYISHGVCMAVLIQYRLFAITVLVALSGIANVTERIEVYVVNVDVTVSDKRGQPVRGLTRDDFLVFEDGKPQKVTNFYVVEEGMAREQGER